MCASLLWRVSSLLPAETAHRAAIAALRSGLLPRAKPYQDAALVTSLHGLEFPNPVGLAAGFDKDAEAVDGLFHQGFGFIELGTVTPLPQPGNVLPRVFRLREDKAVINRYGFNSKGMQAFVRNLQRSKRHGIVGINLGRNKDSLDAAHDYTLLLRHMYEHADYLVINISSPNTVGLRDLQHKKALSELMLQIEATRAELALAQKQRKPVFYKLAPDLLPWEKEDVVEVSLAHHVDGLILSNTTIARPETLKSTYKMEVGGLSGKPLFAPSTQILREFYRLSQGKIPLIGAGGIASATDAYTKILAGASLLQLYTGLVYQGFGLVRQIQEGLSQLLRQDGYSHISQAIGKEAYA